MICNKLKRKLPNLEDDEKMEFLDRPWHGRTGSRPGDSCRLHSCLGCKPTSLRVKRSPCLDCVKVGATAPKAAAVIHTDFEKGFIRAEVIAYDDFIQYKGELGAKDAGKWR